MEMVHPEILKTYGDMPLSMVAQIAKQLPPGIIVQLHNNGEPLLYPHFGDAARMFSAQITGIDTNGKLLLEKSSEIIANLDTITISIIQDDPEADEQREIIKRFLRIKIDHFSY
jgi:MoaA/NifB/PqqE/SkfB family radical SAM enzyme